MPASTTVITALKFQGGVILGSDSQATDTVAEVRWTVEKAIQVKQYSLVISMSGSLGMANRVKDSIVNDEWHSNMFRKRDLVRDAIDRGFKKIYKEIADRNRPTIPLWGLSAFWAEGSPHILEHELSGDCSYHDYFHAIGSGSKTAYAIYRTLGGKNLAGLNQQKCIQVTLRILRTCIGVEPMGVGEPLVLWVVGEAGAKKLSDDQIQAELQSIDAWEERERRLFFTS
ncbi:MAG: hypothetical protein HY680_07100 [Chloroflexi bacterium]|nr:hypothetical protein [Chloroflexota bacterium]